MKGSFRGSLGEREKWSLIQTDSRIVDEILGILNSKDRSPASLCCLKYSTVVVNLSTSPTSQKPFLLRAYPEPPTPSLAVGKSLLSLKSQVCENDLHLLLTPKMKASLNPVCLPIASKQAEYDQQQNHKDDQNHQTDSSSRDQQDSYESYLVSDVKVFSYTAPAVSDLKALHSWLLAETKRYAASWVPGTHFTGIKVGMMLNAPVKLSSGDALNEFFETFACICVAPPRDKNSPLLFPWVEFTILPLDEVVDIASLAILFVHKLRLHLRDFGETERESLQEFSFFTAIYVRKWSQLYLFSGKKMSLFKKVSLFSDKHFEIIPEVNLNYPVICPEILTSTMGAYQLLKYFNSCVGSGFEYIVAAPERSPEEQYNFPPHYLDSIRGLESTCHQMRITQKIAARLTLSVAKVECLCRQATIANYSTPLHPSALTRYFYSKPNSASTRLCRADLLEVTSSITLGIIPIEELITRSEEYLEQLGDRGAETLLGAIEAERDLNNYGEVSERWAPWNWRVPMLNEMLWKLLTDKSGTLRRLPPDLNSALDEFGLEKNTKWCVAISVGRYFCARLPSNFIELLDHNGRLMPGHLNSEDDTVFAIICDQRDLKWDWQTRLRDLLKLKPKWTREELYEYLCPTLKYHNAPSLDEIVASCLRVRRSNPRSTYHQPVSDRPYLVTDAFMHLERP